MSVRLHEDKIYASLGLNNTQVLAVRFENWNQAIAFKGYVERNHSMLHTLRGQDGTQLFIRPADVVVINYPERGQV